MMGHTLSAENSEAITNTINTTTIKSLTNRQKTLGKKEITAKTVIVSL